GTTIKTYGTFPKVSDVTKGITITQGGTTISQGISRDDSKPQLSQRSRFASVFQKSIDTGRQIAAATKNSIVNAGQTIVKEAAIESSKGTGIGASAQVGLIKAAGVVGADVVGSLGDAGSSIVDNYASGVEKTAMVTAMTEFFGFPEGLAKDAVDIATSRIDYKDSTTLTKTKLAISAALAKSPPGAFPEFNDGGIEEWVGRRMDKIIQKKYENKNINKNSKIVGEGREIEKFPTAEFESLRTVLEGVTDKVATTVEFDEAKFLGDLDLMIDAEETFGYHITASKGIDDAVTTIAALVTDNSVTNQDNVGFITDAIASDGSSDKLVGRIKSTGLGKQALNKLGKNAMRARSDNGEGELQMDENAQTICNALGDKAFSGLTKNVKAQLKSTMARPASTKTTVKNAGRTIFRNLAPKK
ncbi:hypothetical protein HDU76_011348, partial [Blyttiomyces sp. JEL0837]